jgi:hypothetical protein
MARAGPARQSLAGPVAARPATAMSADIAGLLRDRRTKALQFDGWRRALAILSGATQADARLCLWSLLGKDVASLCDLPG